MAYIHCYTLFNGRFTGYFPNFSKGWCARELTYGKFCVFVVMSFISMSGFCFFIAFDFLEKDFVSDFL